MLHPLRESCPPVIQTEATAVHATATRSPWRLNPQLSPLVWSIDAEDGEHLLLGETPAELVAHAVRVLTDDALAERLSKAARALVEERYDWGVFAPTVESVVVDLVTPPPG